MCAILLFSAIRSVPGRSRLDEFPDVGIAGGHLLALLLQALDFLLAGHFLLHSGGALLLLEDCCLLGRRVELDLHLVHFLHWRHDHG